ncbi:MAG TPA: DMT family transporter [Candidatus Limnocylindrales bacterium]|nr:DMT family transporter [Candidatus Limnocylindrales bacterium]
MRDHPRLLGTLAVVVAASGFGFLGILSRFSYDAGLAPLPFIAWRGVFGFVVVLIVIAARARSGVRIVDPRSLSRADQVSLAVVGLSAIGLNLGMFLGFGVASIAIVLLAFYTYPALVALVAVGLGHERLDTMGWTALALAVGGMVLVVAGGPAAGDASALQPIGLLLGLAAAGCQVVFVTASRGRYRSVPSEQVMGWQLILVAVACAGASVAVGSDLAVPLANPRVLGLVVVTGLIAAGIPSILFLVGIRAIGGTRAGVLMLIEPLVGVTLAALVLGEALHPIQLAGGLAILGAALLLQRTRPGAPAGESPLEALEPAAVPAREGA